MMRLLELTLADPASNLALDEALLLSHPSSESDADVGVLRLWEPPQMMVVLGRGSSAAAEVHRVACRRRDIPVLRRCSGGATIVTGPGCLMYSLVFRRTGQSALPAVNEIHTQILDQLAVALSTTAFVVVRSGTSDLAIAGPDGLRKFSGNSLRISRNLVLYHGTCLYDFPLGVVAELLAMPPRMPTYRQARSHDSFLCNLALRPEEIRQRVVTALQAHQTMLEWPQEMTSQLVASRYSLASWNEGARHG